MASTERAVLKVEKMEVKPSENSFESVFDHSRGIGKLWSSDPVKWALADTFEVPAVNWRNSRDASGNLKTYDDDQWHLQAVSKTKNSRMRFLAVLRFSPDTVRGVTVLSLTTGCRIPDSSQAFKRDKSSQ